jgi:hypothetical protein
MMFPFSLYIILHVSYTLVAMVTIVSVFWFVWRPKKQLGTGEVCTEAEERLELQAYNTLVMQPGGSTLVDEIDTVCCTNNVITDARGHGVLHECGPLSCLFSGCWD